MAIECIVHQEVVDFFNLVKFKFYWSLELKLKHRFIFRRASQTENSEAEGRSTGLQFVE